MSGAAWWKHRSREDVMKASRRPPSPAQLARRAQLRSEIAAIRLNEHAAAAPRTYIASTTQSWMAKGERG
jgi:hypothetical protein